MVQLNLCPRTGARDDDWEGEGINEECNQKFNKRGNITRKFEDQLFFFLLKLNFRSLFRKIFKMLLVRCSITIRNLISEHIRTGRRM